MNSSSTFRIGFVGVGRMGANMARRLVDQGYAVTAVYDVRGEAASNVASELGGTTSAVATLPEVTKAADVIITVVTDDAAMREIFGGSGPARNLLQAEAEAAGKIFINCATLSPGTHAEVQALALAVGAESLEACMASSIPQARNGELYLMVAGSESTYKRVEPVLKELSQAPRYCGEVGQAAKVKALVNMVMNINTAGLAEGLGLAAALGLDLDMVMEVFSQTGANSRVLQTDGDDMKNREHDCYFSAAHAAKDSGIAQALAREAGLTLPLNDAAKAQYDRMTAAGLGELDKSGIAELTFPGRGSAKGG